MKPDTAIEPLEPAADQDEPNVAPTDSLDDEFLLDEELGGQADLLLDDAELEDEVEFDTQFDETIEDPAEMQLLQDLGIDLDDADPDEDPVPLDFGPVLHDDDSHDDEAAA